LKTIIKQSYYQTEWIEKHSYTQDYELRKSRINNRQCLPLSANNDFLTARELKLGTTESLLCVMAVAILATD
jgi:hypothetical protein